MMTNTETQKFIEKNRHRHISNKVLHAHPSPVHWRTDFEQEKARQYLTGNTDKENSVNFYAGIPYCLPTNPPHCGFCLFPTEKYAGVKSTGNYLTYLAKEADMYKSHYANATLESLYIGGGTPNLLVEHDYYNLMSIINRLFPSMSDNIEKTLEGIPQLFNEQKIKAIKGAGFNRVSMGVQQVDEDLIKYSGRRQTRKQVFDAIENFHKYGLACNVDLIYAWPNQTIDNMLSNLNAIVQSGVKHITHYELNIAGRSNFATKMKDAVADIETKIEMYHIAKDFLKSEGYRQRTVYDWEKSDSGNGCENLHPEKYLYEQNLRDFIAEDNKNRTSSMGGIGFAAVNMRMRPGKNKSPSISAMNHRTLPEYFQAISANRLPIERVFEHDEEDVKMVWLYQSLQEMKIDSLKYNAIFGTSILYDFPEIWKELERLEWVRIDLEQITVVNDGEYYVPLIQSLLSNERVKQLGSHKHTIPLSAIR